MSTSQHSQLSIVPGTGRREQPEQPEERIRTDDRAQGSCKDFGLLG